MDSLGSDDDDLPSRAELEGESTTENLTTSSFSSTPTRNRQSLNQIPLSPGTARKRTNDEVYAKPEEKKEDSTTPKKSPKSKLNFSRAASEPHFTSPSFQQTGFRNIPVRSSSQQPMAVASSQSNELQSNNEDARMNPSFTEQIQIFQDQLEKDYQNFEKSLNEHDTVQDLEGFDWDDLEERYTREVGSKIAAEQEIMSEFAARFQQFSMWMKVSSDREADRGIKRLRTKIAYVQLSEDNLVKKQEHYNKVLSAFQTAMALLDSH